MTRILALAFLLPLMSVTFAEEDLAEFVNGGTVR